MHCCISTLLVLYHTSILMVMFQVNLGKQVPLSFYSFKCSGTEPLWGQQAQVFVLDNIPVTQPSASKHRSKYNISHSSNMTIEVIRDHKP